MNITITIDGLTADEGAPTIASTVDLIAQLRPSRVDVDTGGAIGRPLLAALRARGVEAHALEKRPRPVLAEVQRIAELSQENERLKEAVERHSKVERVLQGHLDDLRVLIRRLD